MKTIILFLSCYLLLFSQSFAQSVAINNTGDSALPSAGLDVDFKHKGLLIPRVKLLSITDSITIHKPANALLVYNINASMINGNGVGLYSYCAKGCATVGWKFIGAIDNGPGVPGQVLTSQGSGVGPTWTTPKSSEWTYFGKLTYDSSAAQQNFSSLPTHDKWKLVFNIYNLDSIGDNIDLKVGINNVYIEGYSVNLRNYGALFTYTVTDWWVIYEGNGEDFDTYNGEVIITGKSRTSRHIKTFYASGTNMLPSGVVALDGSLVGDANNVNSINIHTLFPISGTIELWYQDDQQEDPHPIQKYLISKRE